VTSGDPNEKAGLHGVGSGRYLSGSQPLSYSIFFDNQPTASAPAQTITVTDNLDTSLVDLSTLTLGTISFGDKVVTPAFIPLSLLGMYSTNVDLRPAKSLIIAVAGNLNTTTGVLQWSFTSLDPATGLLTTDPLAGLLPPGAEGSVSFTVAPKGSPISSQVTNKATVVFDRNAPMDTQVWSNSIDKVSPASHIVPLSATQPNLSFNVRWSGSDAGSGIQDYTIFASDNGSPFVPWQIQTTFTAATYTGIAGHTYSFYSTARDLVGNVEALKTGADASTQIVLGGPAKIVASQTLSRDAQNRVVANVTLTNTGGVAAQNVVLSVGKIGTTSASGLPTVKVNIPAGSSVPITLVFPTSVGAAGAATTFTVGGTYTGGSFNFASRITLP
jgi:hypothetical protein